MGSLTIQETSNLLNELKEEKDLKKIDRKKYLDKYELEETQLNFAIEVVERCESEQRDERVRSIIQILERELHELKQKTNKLKAIATSKSRIIEKK